MKDKKLFYFMSLSLLCVPHECLSYRNNKKPDNYELESFEKNLLQHMHNMNENFEKMNHDFEKIFKEIHEQKILQKHIPQNQSQSNISHINQQQMNHVYQQSMASFSTSDQEKTIKISENKNQDSTIYTFDIMYYKKHVEEPQNQEKEQNEVLVEKLQELKNIFNKKFSSSKIENIFKESMTVLKNEPNNKTVLINACYNSNQEKYIITIQDKKNNKDQENKKDSLEVEESETKRRKKRNQKQN